MTRRPAILLVPLALLFVAFGCRSSGSNTNTNAGNANTSPVINTTPTNGSGVTNIPVVNTNTPQPRRTPQEEELQRLAGAFAERYGSYSNQTNFTNLESLLFFMTTSFQNRTQAFIDAERAKKRDTSVYYGIATRAAAVETKSFNDAGGRATFLVQTHRRESIGSTSNTRSFQQDLLVEMRREGGTWKVDAAVWQ